MDPSIASQLTMAVAPWLARGEVTLRRDAVPPAVEIWEFSPGDPSNTRVLFVDLRLEHHGGVLVLAEKAGAGQPRTFGSFEFSPTEASEVASLLNSVFSGSAEISGRSTGKLFIPGAVRWDGGEWYFSTSVGLGLLPGKRTIRKFDPYERELPASD